MLFGGKIWQALEKYKARLKIGWGGKQDYLETNKFVEVILRRGCYNIENWITPSIMKWLCWKSIRCETIKEARKCNSRKARL